MNIENEIATQAIVVDDESVRLVERAALGNIDVVVRRPGAVSATLAKWLAWTVGFVETHEVVDLAYHVVGPRRTAFWLLLLKTKIGLQRVHLEHIECTQCRMMLDAANPTVPDLYLGVPSLESALARAWSQPIVGCPVCGATLARRVIWAEVAR